MKRLELDRMLREWARDTAPDAHALCGLRARVEADLIRSASTLPAAATVHTVGSGRAWPWLARAACAALLLGAGLAWWGAPDGGAAAGEFRAPTCRPMPMAASVPLVRQGVYCGEPRARAAAVASSHAGRLQLARDLQFHVYFQEVSSMPGLAGACRPDDLWMQAVPGAKLDWLAMTSAILEVMVCDN